MKISNLKELIKKVEESEVNIADLTKLMNINKDNKSRNKRTQSFGFFVSGYNQLSVKAIDEDILFQAVIAMIKRTEEVNSKDKQMIEAMELMVSPEVKQAPLAQQMPMQAPPVQAPQKIY
tara:strand:- start:1923 stop:2282 length:360 start_codon:yes stop_codon:yes gene_type:complete